LVANTNFLNTSEAAKILGVSPKTLELWRLKNSGPDFFKVGGRYYYTEEDLFKFIGLCKIENISLQVK
jgi:DNA-binding transcriptional MerR regulator